MVLIKPKDNSENQTQSSLPLYLIDFDSLELSTHSLEEIIDKFHSGELIYENEKYKIPGIS